VNIFLVVDQSHMWFSLIFAWIYYV